MDDMSVSLLKSISYSVSVTGLIGR